MHGLWKPNEGINQRNLRIWADVADKICFGRTYKFGSGSWFSAVQWRQFPHRVSVVRGYWDSQQWISIIHSNLSTIQSMYGRQYITLCTIAFFFSGKIFQKAKTLVSPKMVLDLLYTRSYVLTRLLDNRVHKLYDCRVSWYM